jgi:hypothetical protein
LAACLVAYAAAFCFEGHKASTFLEELSFRKKSVQQRVPNLERQFSFYYSTYFLTRVPNFCPHFYNIGN